MISANLYLFFVVFISLKRNDIFLYICKKHIEVDFGDFQEIPLICSTAIIKAPTFINYHFIRICGKSRLKYSYIPFLALEPLLIRF